ncbi:YqgE/AlgH family protein [Reinekea marinisedimentorum]|uniref:UPF0301 protein BCF53_108199 n=1 Tax=Reinekea marinisedimentorum TaxID=230495 RepID=A0A4R3I6V5_9GAMM|nr:YqgE/AlgH family protein [Reinekea marinisedimentorum]TCS40830.1 putative transcriptional regulator [Reinekea marinisedimentorum]
MSSMNLNHHFLIAMPNMADPYFAGSVTYILQHDSEGTMGLVINHQTDILMSEVYESSGIRIFGDDAGNAPVYQGGPVSSEQGFVLHPAGKTTWQASMVNQDLALTTSRDILDAIAIGVGPEDYLFCLGYSGWSAGQLEDELKHNAWLTVEADNAIIFNPDNSKKYQSALSKLGIDPLSLSSHGGLA